MWPEEIMVLTRDGKATPSGGGASTCEAGWPEKWSDSLPPCPPPNDRMTHTSATVTLRCQTLHVERAHGVATNGVDKDLELEPGVPT